MSVNEKMTAIADAIRRKTGKTEKLNLDGMASGIDEVYEAGKQAEYDAFWNEFQQNGDRTDYAFGFAGRGWNDQIFKPKYDIEVVGTAQYMCGYSRMTNLKAILDSCGVTLDFSKCTRTQSVFVSCENLTILPKIDVSSATNTSNMFSSCLSLHTIEELVVSEKTVFTTCFINCYELENMTMTGTLATNGLNLQWSTKLTHDSLMSIINCLADKSGDTSGTVWEVTLGETNIAKLTQEEREIAENKGWVIG